LAFCALIALAVFGYFKAMPTDNTTAKAAPATSVEPKPAQEPVLEPAPVAANEAVEPSAATPQEPSVVANETENQAQTSQETTQEQTNNEPKADTVVSEEPKAETPVNDEPKAQASQEGGIAIDPSGARINFLSYKMQSKAKVPETGGPATFKNVEFNFANTNGSVAEILTNSTAKIDLTSIDTNKNPIRDNNVKNKFFAHLASQEVSGKITGVKGDDASGDITLSLNFNGVEKEVELKYEVKDGKLTATGEIDLVEGNLFNTAEAFEKFATDPVIQGLHAKKSWSNVTIGFEVPVK
ncbi:MAG: YceI family protein, partial [Campylobacter sp.]|nr:YceI family protein [Campylobacter sp.]